MSSLIMGLVWELPITKAFNSKAKFIALAYADHAWQDGTHAYPSIELVSKKTGFYERTVQRYVRKLVEIGLFIPDGKGPRGTNQFSFPLVQTDETAKLEMKPVGGVSVTPARVTGVSNEHGGGVSPVTPESLTSESLTSELKVVVKELTSTTTTTSADGEIFRLYEAEIGLLTPMIADAIQDAEKTYPPEWLPVAIREAVANNKRSWKYCEAILKRWKTEGFQSSKKAYNPQSKPVKSTASNEEAIRRVANAG